MDSVTARSVQVIPSVEVRITGTVDEFKSTARFPTATSSVGLAAMALRFPVVPLVRFVNVLAGSMTLTERV